MVHRHYVEHDCALVIMLLILCWENVNIIQTQGRNVILRAQSFFSNSAHMLNRLVFINICFLFKMEGPSSLKEFGSILNYF